MRPGVGRRRHGYGRECFVDGGGLRGRCSVHPCDGHDLRPRSDDGRRRRSPLAAGCVMYPFSSCSRGPGSCQRAQGPASLPDQSSRVLLPGQLVAVQLGCCLFDASRVSGRPAPSPARWPGRRPGWRRCARRGARRGRLRGLGWLAREARPRTGWPVIERPGAGRPGWLSRHSSAPGSAAGTTRGSAVVSAGLADDGIGSPTGTVLLRSMRRSSTAAYGGSTAAVSFSVSTSQIG